MSQKARGTKYSLISGKKDSNFIPLSLYLLDLTTRILTLIYLFMFIYLFLLFNNMLCATFIHISWALWNIIVYSFLWQATTRRSYLEVHEFNGNFKGMQVRFRVTSVIGHVFRYFKNLCTLFPLDIYQCTWA